MKVVCLILAFFVLILSGRPCCADRECETKSKVTKSVNDHQTRKERECEGCSPFFSCGSCVGFIISKPVIHQLEFIAEQPQQNYAPYCQPDPKTVSLAIWQPPQLS
ncbi:DUF6660 family protein [Mucilaginibacter daejeonensis]|uniref:DUF6660 family protein n=1 Tax=Mucilaginibacter daejeonensis TaxID=398049 RepID=UPI00374DACF7